MSKFLDRNGNEIEQITAENLADYKNWISQAKEPETANLIASTEVSLKDVVFPAATKEQKSKVADIISRTLARQRSNDRRNEFIDLANKNRDVVSLAWRRMGSAIASRESDFEKVLKTVEERSSSKNLGFALAVFEAGDNFYETGKADDFSKLSNTERELAEEILEVAARDNTDNQGYRALEYVKRLVKNSSMINFKTSPQNREIINSALLGSDNRNRIAVLEKVKPEYFNSDMVKAMLPKYGNALPYKDVSKAKTQAEKNANILPQGYHTFKKAVLHLVEQQNKYDRSNYGDERGLNERYLEVCKQLGLSDEHARNPKAMAGLYLETARKDIEQGRLKRLDEKSLSDVLKHDDGKYYAMLPKEFVEKNKRLVESSLPEKLRLQLREQNVAEMSYGIAYLGDRNRTTAENKKILAALDEEQAKIAPRKKELSQYKAERENEKKQVETLSKISIRKQETAQAVKWLQEAFAQINDYRKKGGSETEEAVLSQEAVEQVMADRLQGKKSVLQEPEQGSLPLIFGRKEEKERREKLSEKISKFNKLLDEAMPKIGERYSGKILSVTAYGDAVLSANVAEQEYSKANQDYWMRQNNIGKYQDRELDELTNRDNGIEQARTRILEKEAKKKEAVKELVGVPDKSALQAVHPDAEKTEKAQIRRQNKQVEDKLAAKEKDFAGKSDVEKVGLQKKRQTMAISKRNNVRTI